MRLLPRLLASAAMVMAVMPMSLSMSGCTKSPPITYALIPPGELPDLHRAGLTKQWDAHVKLFGNETIKKVWRVGESVYVATSEARIVRIDAKTGELRWQQGLGAENFIIFKPVELKPAEGSTAREVLVVTGGEVFTFDMRTGDETRPIAHLGLSVSCDPVVVGNTLCVGGASTFYGLYLDHPDLARWRIPARGDVFVSSPAVLEGNLMFASRKGLLWRVNAETGFFDWKDRKTNGDVVAGLAADNEALYVPALDQHVYAFRSDTGGGLWDTQLEGRLEQKPFIAGDVVLVRSENHGLYVIARSNGVVRFHAEDVTSVATGNEKSIWVMDAAGNLKLLDLSDGDVLATAPAYGVQMVVPNPVDRAVILVTHGGLIGSYSSGSMAEPAAPATTTPAATEPAAAPATDATK